MANSAHVRFENTASDLDDCVDHLERLLFENEDEEELAAAAHIRELCEKFIELYDSYKS